ncbi:MAG: hypothetical protein JWN67_4920 [Actinomycetia bacterium]|nr:hypothetical protein [Actinomycetes bacterium]
MTDEDEAGPSRFWRELADEHEAALGEHGLDTMKRRQALRYFTWQWNRSRLRGSEQLRFLLRNVRPADLARAVLQPVNLRDPAWSGPSWSVVDRWLYAVSVRLLWAYAERAGDPEAVALPEPELGGPFPVQLRGRLISQDLANSAIEVDAVREALAGARPTEILEIGGGYGRFAYVALHLFPEARYTIVDIEPAMTISRWYLTSLFGPDRVRFVHADDAADLVDRFDLALSISSLQEMTTDQVDGYLRLIDRTTTGGTVYLKQWTSWFNQVDDVVMRFEDYPVPDRWVPRYSRPARVQTAFTEAAWGVPA